MDTNHKTLSVTQAADICDVGRTTVGYWIRSGKLAAGRSGKKYKINIQDLLYFLKSNGQKIPDRFEKDNLSPPVFRNFQSCWRYYQGNRHGLDCQKCVAFKNNLEVCFSARNSGALGCRARCETCRYFQEAFYPRLQLIYQFKLPTAIVKDLYFWAGNRQMAGLCGVEKKDLIGMGVEQVVHPSSLEQVIRGFKKWALEEPGVQTGCLINIKNSQSGQIKVKLSVNLLKEPHGAFLIMAERDCTDSTLTVDFMED